MGSARVRGGPRYPWLPKPVRATARAIRDETRRWSWQRVASGAGRGLLKLAYRSKPVPAGALDLVAKVAGGEDPVRPKFQAAVSGRSLADPVLSQVLADTDLGSWTMGAEALEQVGRIIRDIRPSLVLELGSGVSTLYIARQLQRLGRGELISIDQSEEFAQRTRSLLEKAGIHDKVKVIKTGLIEREVLGRSCLSYDLRSAEVETHLHPRRADLLIIDGPAGDDLARLATLPDSIPYLADRAVFVLDDGLRKGEMQVARLWSQMDQVLINGTILAGQGLIVGEIRA